MRSSPSSASPRLQLFLRAATASLLAMVLALVATNLPVSGVSSDIVISQVYGGGGNSGAPYTNDFVELFNRGSAPVSLSGKSIQYTSATGTGNFGATSGQMVVLSGVLQPGQYYLVQLAGGSTGAALPTPDATGTINMSGTSGKVAVVNSTSSLGCNGGSTPCSSAQLALIVDLVGYGSPNFSEVAPAPSPSNTTAIFRAGDGCTDTDNNAADFTAAAPSPRNSASTAHVCGGPTSPGGTGLATPAALAAGDATLLTVAVTPGANPSSTGLAVNVDLIAIGLGASQALFDDATHGDVTAGDNVFSYSATIPGAAATGSKLLPFVVSDAQSRSSDGSISVTVLPPPMPIHAIQGSGSFSPYDGQLVTTQGVVTAVRYNNGFFIQVPDSDVDADPNTSEGIFVYTGSAPPAAAAVGSLLEVTGTVDEYVPASSGLYSPPVTEIQGTVTVTLRGTGYTLPAPAVLTAQDLPAGGTLDQLERYEGMRVYASSLRVVSPTSGTLTEKSATSTSNGVFYAVIDDTPRPFREPGVEVGDPLPEGSPAGVPAWDFNPERLRVDSDGQKGATKIDVSTGALVSNVTGVLDYGYRTWTILPDPAPVAGAVIAVSGGMAATPVPMPDGASEFTVASFNMERFYDAVADGDGDVALNPGAFANRLNKASLAIRTMLHAPDILGVEEVENLATLQAIAAKVSADAVANGEPDPAYAAYLEPGNDPSAINVGFLVRTGRVNVLGVEQIGKDLTIPASDGITPTPLNDRPPLVLTAEVAGPTGDAMPVTVIVNHLRSLSDVDNLDKDFARRKRLGQAEFLAGYIQSRQAANPMERIVSVGDYNAYDVNDGYVDVMGIIEGTPAPAGQVVLYGGSPVSPALTDVTTTMTADQRYSYSYDGTAQMLDHILVNDHALQRLSRAHYARSNADFPEVWRSDPNRPEKLSDHDMPVAYFVFPNAPVLKLNGDNPLRIECCGTYTDPGATAVDGDFGDISSFIQVSGTVDTHTVGSYAVTYTVNNGYTTSTATRTVDVVDTTEPTLALLGDNPMTVEVGSVFVDPGATATDACAGDLTGQIKASGGVDAAHVGTYQITYTVSDGYNTAAVTRIVNVVDTTPPVVSAIVPTAYVLWPANHKFVPVGLTYTVTDNSGSATCSVGVVSNEPINGTGDGDTSPDWLVLSAKSIQLRAERAGTGSGRLYTVTVTCRDASGNVTVNGTEVSVPRNQGK